MLKSWVVEIFVLALLVVLSLGVGILLEAPCWYWMIALFVFLQFIRIGILQYEQAGELEREQKKQNRSSEDS